VRPNLFSHSTRLHIFLKQQGRHDTKLRKQKVDATSSEDKKSKKDVWSHLYPKQRVDLVRERRSGVEIDANSPFSCFATHNPKLSSSLHQSIFQSRHLVTNLSSTMKLFFVALVATVFAALVPTAVHASGFQVRSIAKDTDKHPRGACKKEDAFIGAELAAVIMQIPEFKEQDSYRRLQSLWCKKTCAYFCKFSPFALTCLS
jgi:hypothetical protein